MKTILFVCSGNLCRSPMAEGFLQRRLTLEGRDGEFRVRSAGTWAVAGAPASTPAVQVMDERGVEIGDHRTHDLIAEDVESADLILTMTEGHAQAVRRSWPQHERKVHLLSEMVGRRYDIEDPYGSSIEVYRACADEIEALIEDGYARILELAAENT
jgi:protein-tyrosine-phosphatase